MARLLAIALAQVAHAKLAEIRPGRTELEYDRRLDRRAQKEPAKQQSSDEEHEYGRGSPFHFL
jgi:hypothetical protein